MKINAKYYNIINTTPLDVQNTDMGVVEVYSLNDYPQLFATHALKSKFTMWCCDGVGPYKLLIEDGYYETMGTLYSSDINTIWLDFYKNITISKKKSFLTILLPVFIIVFAILGFLNFTNFVPDESKVAVTLAFLVIVFIANTFVNKNVANKVKQMNLEAIDKIKGVVGATKFDELLDAQEAYVKEFFKKQYEETYGETYEDPLEVEGIENGESEDVSASDVINELEQEVKEMNNIGDIKE